MKPKEKKPQKVFQIIDRKTNNATGSYSRACCDEFDFYSVESARTANCHGMFKDKSKYRIAEYEVTYKLINPDSDNAESVPIHKETDNSFDTMMKKKAPDIKYKSQFGGNRFVLHVKVSPDHVNIVKKLIFENLSLCFQIIVRPIEQDKK